MLTMALAIILAGQRVPTVTFTIPVQSIRRAKLKAKLHDDLFLSLANDERGIYDLKLEKEIADLESKLLKEKGK